MDSAGLREERRIPRCVWGLRETPQRPQSASPRSSTDPSPAQHSSLARTHARKQRSDRGKQGREGRGHRRSSWGQVREILNDDGPDQFLGRHRLVSASGTSEMTDLAARDCVPCRGGMPPLQGTQSLAARSVISLVPEAETSLCLPRNWSGPSSLRISRTWPQLLRR